MTDEERDAVLEFAAKICDEQALRHDQRVGQEARFAAAASTACAFSIRRTKLNRRPVAMPKVFPLSLRG